MYEVCKFLGLTSHQWAGFTMLASQAFWLRLPEDIRDSVVRNTKKFVPLQRAYVRAVNAHTEQKLRDRGMVVTSVDTGSFRKALAEAGFYKDWRSSCGATAWSLMEAQTGAIG